MSGINERKAGPDRPFRIITRITRDLQVPLWEGATFDDGWRCIPQSRTAGRGLGDLGRLEGLQDGLVSPVRDPHRYCPPRRADGGGDGARPAAPVGSVEVARRVPRRYPSRACTGGLRGVLARWPIECGPRCAGTAQASGAAFGQLLGRAAASRDTIPPLHTTSAYRRPSARSRPIAAPTARPARGVTKWCPI
jgi:hypothetical protein